MIIYSTRAPVRRLWQTRSDSAGLLVSVLALGMCSVGLVPTRAVSNGKAGENKPRQKKPYCPAAGPPLIQRPLHLWRHSHNLRNSVSGHRREKVITPASGWLCGRCGSIVLLTCHRLQWPGPSAQPCYRRAYIVISVSLVSYTERLTVTACRGVKAGAGTCVNLSVTVTGQFHTKCISDDCWKRSTNKAIRQVNNDSEAACCGTFCH